MAGYARLSSLSFPLAYGGEGKGQEERERIAPARQRMMRLLAELVLFVPTGQTVLADVMPRSFSEVGATDPGTFGRCYELPVPVELAEAVRMRQYQRDYDLAVLTYA